MEHPQKNALDNLERSHLVAYGQGVHEWYRTLLSLSSAGLTLLVSLQDQYMGDDYRLLIQICWISLAFCILFSLLLLWGKAQTRLDGANALRTKRVSGTDQAALEMLQQTNGAYFVERRIFSVSRYLQTASFLCAVVSLTLFAVLNV